MRTIEQKKTICTVFIPLHYLFELIQFQLQGSKQSRELTIEQKLIVAAQNNPARFAPLYDKYHRQIFLFIFKKVKNEDIAGDITSTVFLKALLNIKKFKFQGFPLSSWLYRIASNETNMYFRKSKKTNEVEIMESDVIELMTEMKEGIDVDRQEMLIAALNNLPLELTELIELRYFEKMSFKRIGEIKGISEGNAKIRVYRVIEKLKTILKTN